MGRGRRWPRLLAAGVVGVVLGALALVAGALLLYGSGGFLRSAGSIIALTLAAAAAGLWVGAPDARAPGHRRLLGRWMFAIAALVIASFAASFWLRQPVIQTSAWGGPLALVLLLVEPVYALGALLAGLEARRRAWLGERWFAARAAERRWSRQSHGEVGTDAAEMVRRRTGSGRRGTRGSSGRAGGVAVPALLGAAVGAALAGAWMIPAFPPGLVFLGLGLLLTAAGSLEMGLSMDPKEGAMAERVVIVTGVGDVGQVGYAVAEAFVGQGARVVVSSRGDSVVERARGLGDDVVAVAADLMDAAGAESVVEAARERWGRLDVVVNVAGGLHVLKSVEETSPEEWQQEVDSNVRTAFLMSRAALPLLRESGGAIVNFASPAGVRGVKGMAAYSAGKAGVVALTRSLAREESGAGVRVNAIAPGMIDTAQNREAVSDPDAVDWVTREEVAEVVLFLASGAASGVTGETIGVSGR